VLLVLLQGTSGSVVSFVAGDIRQCCYFRCRGHQAVLLVLFQGSSGSVVSSVAGNIRQCC
jgi:ribosomal protein L6P/L9E